MAGNFSVHVNIGGRLLPSFGGAIRSAESAIGRLGKIAAVHTNVVGTINRAAAGVSGIGKRVQEVGRSVTAAATPMALLGAVVVKNLYDAEKYGNALQAVTEMTREQRMEIEKLAQSQKYFTYKDSMKSALELGKTGFNNEQIKGTLPGALKLARAGGVSAQDGTDIVTNIMTSMRLPMESAKQAEQSMTRVADALAYTANKTNTDVLKLGETFKFAGGLAAKAGMDVETFSAMSGKMANEGIRGAEAGVALRSALVRMVRPTKPAMAALSRLGINIKDFVTSTKEIDAGGVVKSLQAQGINAQGATAAIQKILNDPNAKFDLSATVAKITDVVAKSMGSAGSAIDRDVIATGINDALIGAADKIDLVRFLAKLKEKGASLGDLTAIFQTQHGSRMLSLFNGPIQDAIDDVKKNAGGYADRAVKLQMQGIVGAVERLDASLARLVSTLAKTGVIDNVASAFERISDGLDRLGQSNPALLKFGTYAALATLALGPLAIVAGASMRALAFLGRGLMLLGAAATTGLAARLAAIGAGIAAIAGPRLAAMALGLSMLTRLGAGATLAALGASILALGRAVLMFPIVALRAIGVAMWGLAANPVGIAITTIVASLAALGAWVASNWNGLKNFFEGFANGFRDAIPPNVSGAIDGVVSGLKSIYETISSVLGPLDASEEKWRQWGNSAGKFVGEVVSDITELPGKIAGLGGQFASAMGQMAQAGWNAFKSIDWAGLGSALVDAIVSGVTAAAGRLVASVKAMAANAASAVKGAFSFGGGGGSIPLAGARAAGGPVTRGLPYLVGERGPEIFAPSSMGRIIPNNAISRSGSLSGGRELSAKVSGAPAMIAAREAGKGGSRGPVTFNVNVSAPGGDGGDIARRVKVALRDELRRMESDQAGSLSD